MIFDPRRAWVIGHKEVRHILRDRLTVKVMLLMPAILVCFFGFAIDFNVESIGVMANDGDRSQASRGLIEMMDRSGYFHVTHEESVVEAEKALSSDRAKAVLLIPPKMEREMLTGRKVNVQVLLDGADDQTAGIISSYLTQLHEAAKRRLTGAPPGKIDLRTRFVFNEELNSRWYVIPGLFATTLGLFAILMPALALSREWETGSMEVLLSTKVRPLEIIVGKMFPYLAICLADAVVMYVVARVVFGLPFEGHHGVLALGTLIYVLGCIGQGLLIGGYARGQRLSYTLANQTGNFPIQMLSGFLFPFENMPILSQFLVSCLLPARWYMVILRSTFLRATEAEALAMPLAGLSGVACLLLGLAWWNFKTDLEA